jgi:hypothetical protein
MGRKVNIDLVPGLRIRVSACVRKKGEKTTYRIPRKQLEDSLEVTAHVSFDEFPNIWLLLDV